MNSGNAAIPAAAPQRSLVIDFDYFRTCTANKEWVSTCMANQAFIQQCIDQRERLQPFLSALKCDDGSRENIDARSPPCSQVSAVYEDFPMLASSSPRDLPMTTYEKNPKLDEQRSPVMMDSNEDGRQAVRGKRKYDLISTQQHIARFITFVLTQCYTCKSGKGSRHNNKNAEPAGDATKHFYPR
ncbi:hypothetical protein ISCGN_027052 [Ixodes scapularis]